jgi:hypothetical protein
LNFGAMALGYQNGGCDASRIRIGVGARHSRRAP